MLYVRFHLHIINSHTYNNIPLYTPSSLRQCTGLTIVMNSNAPLHCRWSSGEGKDSMRSQGATSASNRWSGRQVFTVIVDQTNFINTFFYINYASISLINESGYSYIHSSMHINKPTRHNISVRLGVCLMSECSIGRNLWIRNGNTCLLLNFCLLFECLIYKEYHWILYLLYTQNAECIQPKIIHKHIV